MDKVEERSSSGSVGLDFHLSLSLDRLSDLEDFVVILLGDDTDIHRTAIRPDGLYRRLKKNLEG